MVARIPPASSVVDWLLVYTCIVRDDLPPIESRLTEQQLRVLNTPAVLREYEALKPEFRATLKETARRHKFAKKLHRLASASAEGKEKLEETHRHLIEQTQAGFEQRVKELLLEAFEGREGA